MRYLAFDLGDRRIGVAVSDPTGLIARPVAVVRRTSRAADFARFSEIAEKHNVQALVVGLPLNMDGTEGSQAAWVRDYSAALAEALDLPLYLWDERLTTEDAADILRAQGKRPREHQDWIDAIAASVILQSFLNAKELPTPE
jgi:putative Holliday junction resolvase